MARCHKADRISDCFLQHVICIQSSKSNGAHWYIHLFSSTYPYKGPKEGLESIPAATAIRRSTLVRSGRKRIANLPQWQSVWGMFAESMSVGSQTQYYPNKVAVFVYVNKCKNCSVVSLPSRSKYFSLHMLQDDHPCREKYLWSLKLDDSVAYSLGPNFIFFQRKPAWMQDKEKEAHKAVVFSSWWASSFVWAMWSK